MWLEVESAQQEEPGNRTAEDLPAMQGVRLGETLEECKVKLIIGLMLLAAPAMANEFDEHAMANAMEWQANSAIIQTAFSQPVVVNAAGDGCHWAVWTMDDGSPKTVKGEDGRVHKAYMKICDDDPYTIGGRLKDYPDQGAVK